MKKLLLTSLVALGLSVSANAADKSKTIIVGATPIPHAEILEVVKPILAKDGYTLEIKEFNDYTTPNLSTEDGDLDANFFQHIPYLEEFNKNKGTHLVKTVGVHIEPMGVYSKKIKDIKTYGRSLKIGKNKGCFIVMIRRACITFAPAAMVMTNAADSLL